ncbi:vinorine synthase-like [Camellia sinensis]|uniref:vinorine synthase-like n=1 Tax=Camellia sinensis TaxID=4442 RepID=UPI001035F275|nr:vinorine synthase-like [Camellia sinensis]
MMEIKVEVIARETIKPSSPTPHHLNTFKLSLIDQFMPASYTPLVLYYATPGGSSCEERSQLLKNSLSQILTRYYPLAGRIKDPLFVDCNDDGVDYIETRVYCPISAILKQPKSELQNHFIPIKFKESGSGSLLLIQASFFEYGGMAIGIYTNHKLADATSFTTFLKAWATTASGFPDAVSPDFTTPSIFPAGDDFQTPPYMFMYVFNASKLHAFKAETANVRVQQPTRMEAIMALLWKCAMDAFRSRLGLGSTNPRRPSILVISANIRACLVLPLPESSSGNIGRPLVVHADDESENEMNLSNLVSSIRESKLELSKNCGVSNICGSLAELRKLQMRGGGS